VAPAHAAAAQTGSSATLWSRDPSCEVCTIVHILDGVAEWDPEKAAQNLKKHGVDFADAATVLSDELAVTILDDSEDEERFVTMGTDALGRVLVVAYAWPGEEPRIISARKATRPERRQYESKR